MKIKNRDGEIISQVSSDSLTRADLTGANLTRADLTWANLSGADLYGANLSWADLTGANLTRADLTWADLTGANLTRADLTWADLTGANLSGANLSGADLTGADLTGANLFFINGVIGFYGGKHFGFAWKKENETIIKIGCLEYTTDYWTERYEEIGKMNGYNEKEIKLYASIIRSISENF